MLRAMHQVMGWQEPFVRSSPRLRAAARTGIAYWRDHFGHTTVKEIVGNLRRGNVSRALTALAGLMWYVRGRVLLFPPRYAGRLFRQMWRLLHSRARPRASINECSSL